MERDIHPTDIEAEEHLEKALDALEAKHERLRKSDSQIPGAELSAHEKLFDALLHIREVSNNVWDEEARQDLTEARALLRKNVAERPITGYTHALEHCDKALEALDRRSVIVDFSARLQEYQKGRNQARDRDDGRGRD